MYFIYLDSKIIGTAKQIIAFFEQGIFDKRAVKVLIKKYKHASSQKIYQILAEQGITCVLVDYADLDNLEGRAVFYPFNAQSNCRAVANRNLLHIFITHGESNKVASIKPIIRIYDYVVTAGQAGIDRYLNHGIFFPADVAHRLLPLGDTFIGQTGLASPQREQQGDLTASSLGATEANPILDIAQGQDATNQPEAVLFFAPTWEGGISRENYSSLSFPTATIHYLLQACALYRLNKILIKPHPNTGHRDKLIFYCFLKQLCLTKPKHIEVVVFDRYIAFPPFKKRLLRHKLKFTQQLGQYSAPLAFCDISAVETQLLNENIPYYIFYFSPYQALFAQHNFANAYAKRALQLDAPTVSPLAVFSEKDKLALAELKAYNIDASISSQPKEARIAYLWDCIQAKRGVL